MTMVYTRQQCGSVLDIINGDITVSTGGVATIQNDTVEASMLNFRSCTKYRS